MSLLLTLIAIGLFEKTVQLRLLVETLWTRPPLTTVLLSLVLTSRFGILLC